MGRKQLSWFYFQIAGDLLVDVVSHPVQPPGHHVQEGEAPIYRVPPVYIRNGPGNDFGFGDKRWRTGFPPPWIEP